VGLLGEHKLSVGCDLFNDIGEDAVVVIYRYGNALERLNQEMRRCERVIRIFLNQESVIRLPDALLCEQSEPWMNGRKWLDMTEYLQPDASPERQDELRKAA